MAGSIRFAVEEDAGPIREVYAPLVRDSAVSFQTEVPSESDFRRRIREIGAKTPWLVFEDGGTLAGYAYASQHRAREAYQWSVEVSVYVDSGSRRRGVGRALYSALFETLRRLGYCNAYAGITLPNPASIGLHKAMGFEPVGVYRSVGYKRGAWHDVSWWQLRLQDPDGDPAPPRAPSPGPHSGF